MLFRVFNFITLRAAVLKAFSDSNRPVSNLEFQSKILIFSRPLCLTFFTSVNMAKAPNVQMNNGLSMPGFGLGTSMGFFQQLYVGYHH